MMASVADVECVQSFPSNFAGVFDRFDPLNLTHDLDFLSLARDSHD